MPYDSELEQVLYNGIHGSPEIKKDEKQQFLGLFREQVIVLLSTKQVKETAIYPEIVQALKDRRSAKLIINGSIDILFRRKYQLLSKKLNIPFSVVFDPDYAKSTGLVIADDNAVNIHNVTIEERNIRLRNLGAWESLIQAAGRKICPDCLRQIITIDPHEEINYDELTWIERILGDHCPAHDKD